VRGTECRSLDAQRAIAANQNTKIHGALAFHLPRGALWLLQKKQICSLRQCTQKRHAAR
jgi:hypothetical protein